MQRNVLLVLVCAMLSATGLCAMDRGLGNPGSVYIPKGTVAASLSCGFDNWKATGEESSKGIILAGLVDEVNGNLSLIDVSAGLSWFFRDNLSLGVRFG